MVAVRVYFLTSCRDLQWEGGWGRGVLALGTNVSHWGRLERVRSQGARDSRFRENDGYGARITDMVRECLWLSFVFGLREGGAIEGRGGLAYNRLVIPRIVGALTRAGCGFCCGRVRQSRRPMPAVV